MQKIVLKAAAKLNVTKLTKQTATKPKLKKKLAQKQKQIVQPSAAKINKQTAKTSQHMPYT
ncbi:MAG: hypothetical protein JKX85_08290 [Phycisphaeraceae bacterium]|nr:hypothetical protein [Phycisphaeraceae bacterium]